MIGKSKGAILIIVLVFCLITAVIAQGAMEVGYLQLKMAINFKNHIDVKTQAENEIINIENQFSKAALVKTPQATFLQFVPDTLAFGESQGINFYRIAVNKQDESGAFVQLMSTFCVRNQQIEEIGVMDDDKLDYINNLNADSIVDVKVIQTHSSHNLLLVAFSKNDNKTTQLAFVRFPQAEIVRTFTIEGKLSSKLFIADTQSKGKADCIYVGTQKSELVTISMDSPFVDEWEMTVHKDLVEGEIIGTPILGRHPQGKGCLLYCLVEKNKQRSIQVLTQNKKNIHHFYTLENSLSFGQPLLWQGYVIAVIHNNLVGIYDAFSGEQQQIIPLLPFKENSVPMQDCAPPVVVFNQPLDKNPQVFISTRHSQKYCEAPILASRLGRKTWGVG